MNYTQLIIDNLQYIIPGIISACFLVVNIIQAIRSHDKSKLNEAIRRLPEMIRYAEECYDYLAINVPSMVSTTTTTDKGIRKKSMVESFLMVEYGVKFVHKYMTVFDDAIEDILNTPQKKGGSHDGISQENEER